MILGLSKRLGQVAILKGGNLKKKSRILAQHSIPNEYIQMFTQSMSKRFSSLQAPESKAEIISDLDFIIQRLEEEDCSQSQQLSRKENYEIIFPEDSREISFTDIRYNCNNESHQKLEYYTAESHLDEFIMFLHDDINHHNNNSNTANSTSDSSSKSQFNHKEASKDSNSKQNESKLKERPYEERRVLFFNAGLKNISKNCTYGIINKLIQVIDLYPQIPNHLIPQYSRKIQQAIQTVFYRELGITVPLQQARRILFFAAKYNYAITPSLTNAYFSHHIFSNHFSIAKDDFYHNSSSAAENKHDYQLKFDNIIDLIIFFYLKREYPLLAQNNFITESAMQSIEEMVKGIKEKKVTFKFMSFLMLYSQLIQMYTQADTDVQKTLLREKKLIEDVSQIIFQILHQIKIAEQKVEVLLLFILAGEKEKADFYFPVVKDHVKQNIDMLNFTDEFKQVLCQNISLLKQNHENSFYYFMQIILEWTEFSTKCLNALFNSRNNLLLDLPFTIKQNVFKDIHKDSLQAKPMSAFLSTANKSSDIKASSMSPTYVHPSMRFRINFQTKLVAYNKFTKQFSYKDDTFLSVIKDMEQYDSSILSEELLFNGISQLFVLCQKMRIQYSPIFANFEDHIINLFENHSFENYQLKLALTVLISYANSSHVLSQRFIETSLVFLSYNMKRFETSSHNYIYKYLNFLLMRVHLNDFGPEITFQSAIRKHFNQIMHALNKVNILESTKFLTISTFELKSFYTTLKIVAPEWFEKNPYAQQVLDQVNIGNQSQHSNLTESSFAQEMQAVLDELNIEYEKEKLVGFYYADFLLPKSNLILEVNGPHHYILSTEEINQSYRLKKFQLNAMGYSVYDIPFMRFNQVNLQNKSQVLEDIKLDLKEMLLNL